ncbi:MAG: hypothetical protein K8W52_22895 [Deltaproteobacteria bacterium]|nr:hypothetical protein [Deltaproteobacteria bacterium]
MIAARSFATPHTFVDQPRPLAEVLAFREPAVIAAFRARWDVSAADADELWLDLLRWLWLCAHDRGQSRAITASMTLVDELWHAFILSTRAYAWFCADYLGGYVHHQPGDAHADASPEAARLAMRAQIADVHDLLGAEVAIRWYQGYAQRYPSAALDGLVRARGAR